MKDKKEATFIVIVDDVTLDDVLQIVGDRTFISIDEIKHSTHLAMGPCRGKRCIPRLRTALRAKGIEIVGVPHRGHRYPILLTLGEIYLLKPGRFIWWPIGKVLKKLK